MPQCEYVEYEGKNFVRCNEPASIIAVPTKFKSKGKHNVCLCQKHKEFVIDALDYYSVEKTKAEIKKENNTSLF
jgi:hypothetical protein